jgi:hypothetical protein
VNYLLRLALNCDPPDPCFLSSQDYRCEAPAPGSRLDVLIVSNIAIMGAYSFISPFLQDRVSSGIIG